MSTALITGGAGFIGSHLAEHLLAQGETVIVLDNLSTGRFDNIRHLVERDRFSHVIADLEEREIVEPLINEADVVYHLAATVGVQLVVDDPVRTIETNIDGTEIVLQAASRTGKAVLIASTSEVYGNNENVPFREDDKVTYGPTSVERWSYAYSKAIDEFLAMGYAQTRGLPCAIVRLFNTVGPRQVGRYGMVVPRFVSQALRGGPITVYGDGEQSRCFCHVKDVVPALHKLVGTDKAVGQVVNIGSDQEVTINELAQRVRDKTDPAIEIRHLSYEQAYSKGFEDMRRRVPCVDRARDLIGFEPRFDLDQILDDMIEHMKTDNMSEHDGPRD